MAAAQDDDWTIGGIDVRDLPKVSLHDHLDGGLRPETIVELAEPLGIELPARDAEELEDWFHESADSGSLPTYLQTFDVTLAVMQTSEGLERVAREFVLDLADDGVIYGEVRWAPEQHLQRGLSLDQAVEAVQAGLEAGAQEVRHQGATIRTGQLVTAMRHLDRGLEIAELALRHRDRGVVGFDIAGPEAGFPPSRHRVAFDHLAKHCFPVTVHAGEADGIESIRSALLDGRALRLGHGVRIAEDLDVQEESDGTFVTLGEVAKWVRDREIPLELSPQSNLQTGAIEAWGDDLDSHPFDMLYQLDFRVTVNVDNRLMSDTSLSKELLLLSRTFEYDLGELQDFQLNAAAGAFLPFEERQDLADAIDRGFGER